MRDTLSIGLLAATLSTTLVTAAASSGPGCPAVSAQWREAVQQRLNALRSEGEACAGGMAASGLQWSADLERVAQSQAAWLAQRQALDHAGPDGQNLGERAQSAGYRYARVAENLASGTVSVEHTLELWRRSEGHCRNLFDGKVTEVALVCQPGPGGPWWVMTLGRPRWQ